MPIRRAQDPLPLSAAARRRGGERCDARSDEPERARRRVERGAAMAPDSRRGGPLAVYARDGRRSAQHDTGDEAPRSRPRGRVLGRLVPQVERRAGAGAGHDRRTSGTARTAARFLHPGRPATRPQRDVGRSDGGAPATCRVRAAQPPAQRLSALLHDGATWTDRHGGAAPAQGVEAPRVHHLALPAPRRRTSEQLLRRGYLPLFALQPVRLL